MLPDRLLKIKDDFVVFMRFRTIDNPVNSGELESRFKMPGTDVRCLIEQLRNEGMPISNTKIVNGQRYKIYFWAKNWNEIEATVSDLESRSYKMLTTCKNLRQKFNQYKEPSLF